MRNRWNSDRLIKFPSVPCSAEYFFFSENGIPYLYRHLLPANKTKQLHSLLVFFLWRVDPRNASYCTVLAKEYTIRDCVSSYIKSSAKQRCFAILTVKDVRLSQQQYSRQPVQYAPIHPTALTEIYPANGLIALSSMVLSLTHVELVGKLPLFLTHVDLVGELVFVPYPRRPCWWACLCSLPT